MEASINLVTIIIVYNIIPQARVWSGQKQLYYYIGITLQHRK